MALSTIQKVALFSGLVLCVSLLLPKTFLSRGKQPGQQEGNPGRFPAAAPHTKPTDGRTAGSHFPRSHVSEAMAKAKAGSGGGGGSGTRQSLVGQIIPIYGFGILLYILYILFKLSSRSNSPKIEPKSAPIANGNLKRKITDYELSQLQDKLKETEEAMEKIISRLGPNCERVENNVSNDEEQQLLRRLKDITRVMKEGKLLDGMSPEQEAEEAPYMEDWEGYPDETYPIFNEADQRRKHDTIFVDRTLLTQPSAEEIAESMEFADDETPLFTECLVEEIIANLNEESNNSSQVNFVAPKEVSISNRDNDKCQRFEEDDPAVIAENADFISDSCSDPGEQCVDEFFVDSEDDKESSAEINSSNEDDFGTLRKRNKKGLEY
ncbi:protein RIC-3 [Bombina bombina]|uniref:protein RIC-3 n=1 Tax=Bombina bombina TaxID=8345 RepID=UPI00235B2151|nr:protein RIC-3 [Bombina bombina]